MTRQPTFVASVNGGIKLTRPSVLEVIGLAIIPTIERGEFVYVRDHVPGGRTAYTITVRLHKEHAPVAHNSIGEEVELPRWGESLLRLVPNAQARRTVP